MQNKTLRVILGVILISCSCCFLPLAGILIFSFFLYYSGYLYMNGITPCNPPPTISVDGVAGGTAFTWIDQNRNGIFENGDEPLSNVEILQPFGMEPVFTDKTGFASVYGFKPGCVCKCWEGEIIEVKRPEGYCNTTPLIQNLTGDDAIYQFGFFKDVTCGK
jgi:hypothetical protein